jgi:hypothetical protein
MLTVGVYLLHWVQVLVVFILLCDHWNLLNGDLHRWHVLYYYLSLYKHIYIVYYIVISIVCCIVISPAEKLTMPIGKKVR